MFVFYRFFSRGGLVACLLLGFLLAGCAAVVPSRPEEPSVERPDEPPVERPVEAPIERPVKPPAEPTVEPPTEPTVEPPTEPPIKRPVERPVIRPERLIVSPDRELAPLRVFLMGFVDRGEVPAIGLLLARQGRIVFQAAFGFADIDAGKPFQADSLVYLSALSQPISATAVMMLVDEGVIGLDDPVSMYLPEFRDLRFEDGIPAPCPTIRQLLSHTSGWPGIDEMSPKGSKAVRNLDLTLASSAALIAQVGLKAKPGARFSGSDIGYNVAGRIVEVVSGEPFDVFLKKRLLDPLGMVDTTFRPTAAQSDRIAVIYKPSPSGGHISLLRHDPEQSRRPLLLIGSGLYASAVDLAAFLQMHRNDGTYGGHRLLSLKAVNEMQKHQIDGAELSNLPLAGMTSFGLGWVRGRGSDRRSALEVGHVGAFGTVGWIDRERDLVGVLFTPMPAIEANDIHQQVRSRVRELIPIQR